MRTAIYEADPFSGRRGRLLTSLDTDYRFERGDEFTLDGEEGSLRVRVIQVRLRISGGKIERELVVLRL